MLIITFECTHCGNNFTLEKGKYMAIPNVFMEAVGVVCPHCGTMFKKVDEVDINIRERLKARQDGRSPLVVLKLPFKLKVDGNRSHVMRSAIVQFIEAYKNVRSSVELFEKVATKLNVSTSKLVYYAYKAKRKEIYTFRVSEDLKRSLTEMSSRLKLPVSKIVLLSLLHAYPELYRQP